MKDVCGGVVDGKKGLLQEEDLHAGGMDRKERY